MPNDRPADPVARWDAWNRGGGPRYPRNEVVQFLFRRFPDRAARAGCRVLDLGCGSGVHTVFLAAEGFAAHGTDLSPVAIANSRDRLAAAGLSAGLAVGPVENIDAPNDGFDALICIGVLECCGPALLAPALAEMLRVLKPGGVALALFASDRDFRLAGDNPLGLNGFSEAEVAAALDPLRDRLATCWADRTVTSFEGGRIAQDEHLLTLVKA